MKITIQANLKIFKLKPANKKQAALNEECHRFGPSLDEFSDTLEQVDFQIRFLASLIYRLTQESDIKTENSIRILRTPDEIANYLYKRDADCVMFNSPEHMPVVLKRKELGWVQDMNEFANWLTVHWASEILVIAVS